MQRLEAGGREVRAAGHAPDAGRTRLCSREHTETGTLLIFPSYYGRERPELVGHPAVLVSYRFAGFLDDIYATLVVRLHHTKPFQQDQLWRYAADFKTLTGKQLGVKMTRRSEGAGELEVYFDPGIPRGGEDHLQPVCPRAPAAKGAGRRAAAALLCPALRHDGGQPGSGDEEAGGGQADILCVNCEKRILLWDEMEDLFASDETNQRVRELQEQSASCSTTRARSARWWAR